LKIFHYLEFIPRHKSYIKSYRWLVIIVQFAYCKKRCKCFFHNSIEKSQITLRLFPKVIVAVDMVSGFEKFLRVINAVMSELINTQSVIALNDISLDNALWLDCISIDRNQSIF
jgi:hypothetical protein